MTVLEFVAINPDLNPGPWLCEEEQRQYKAFRFQKRRMEWLAGRIAAKKLMRKILGGNPSPKSIQIVFENGGPCAKMGDVLWPISISHSNGLAAAAALKNGDYVGMDLEVSEPRNPAWLDMAFHDAEKVRGLSDAELTELWTQKEAVLKYLRLGLKVDLNDIRLLPGPHGARTIRFSNQAEKAWKNQGSPAIRLEKLPVDKNFALSVAHSHERTTADN